MQKAVETFFNNLKKSKLLSETQLAWVRSEIEQTDQDLTVKRLASRLVSRELLTRWQAHVLLTGRNTFFLGPYKLIDRIGQGGMGVVLKAYDTKGDRIVAVKGLDNQHRAKNVRAVARFRREIEAAKRLKHPNTVACYDADSFRNAQFLVMEYVDGPDLEAVIRRMRRLEISVACEYIRQAAEGLQHAHEQGIVHRDIKPNNILVSRPADQPHLVKLLDMGLASLTSGVEITDAGNLTRTGQVMGTPDYMSPEHVKDSKRVDIRSDIFGLGCTLFRLLTGKVPFTGTNFTNKVLARVETNAPNVRSLRPEVPEELDKVVAKMLARNRKARYQTPAEVAQALSPFAEPVFGELVASAAPPESADVSEPSIDRDVKVFALQSPTPARDLDEPPTSSPSEHAPVSTPIPRPRKNSAKPFLIVCLTVVVLMAVYAGSQPSPENNVTLDVANRENSTDKTDHGVLRNQTERRHQQGLSNQNPPGKHNGQGNFIASPNGNGTNASNGNGTSNRDDTTPRDVGEGTTNGETGSKNEPAENGTETASTVPAPEKWLEQMTFAGHTGSVHAVAFSPDGLLLVSGSSDRTVKLWNVETGLLKTTFTGHTLVVPSVLFSPDGTIIASASYDRTIRLWDVKTGGLQRTLTTHKDSVLSVSFSPDGNTLASGCLDNTIKLWDVETGEERMTLGGHSRGVSSVAFSSDGNWLVSADGDGNIILWDASTGKGLKTLARNSGAVYSIAFSPDGNTLASAALQRIDLWDINKGHKRQSLTGNEAVVSSVVFSPDGKLLASAGSDKIKLWDVATGRKQATLWGHNSLVLAVAFAPNGNMLASAGNGAIKLWAPESANAGTPNPERSEAEPSEPKSPELKAPVSASR